MGERRKRKSMWDVEGEMKQFPGMSEHNSSHDFSSSRASAGPKSRDHSGRPSRESNEEKSSVGQVNAGFDKSSRNSPEGKGIGGGGKYINRVLESGAVSIAESIGEKNTRSNIQHQDHGVAQSYVLDEAIGSGNPVHPIFFSGQDMSQNGHSFATDGKLNVVRPVLANGFGSDLDGPEAQLEIETVQSSLFGVSRGLTSPTENEKDNTKEVEYPGNSKLKEETALVNSEGDEVTNNNKVARLFKNSLIEFVKEILKPTWKEGRLSRDVHKTIVKKVVDKVTSTVQDDHIPKTQEKVDQYLLFSKLKIGKLVQAYVERSVKTDS